MLQNIGGFRDCSSGRVENARKTIKLRLGEGSEKASCSNRGLSV